MREVAQELRLRGFRVTSRWLDSPTPISGEELSSPAEAARLAAMDLRDVQSADVCIAFTEPADHAKPGRGGRHTELGIALANEAEVVLVGRREHIFHCLPQVKQFDHWEAAKGHLLVRFDAQCADPSDQHAVEPSRLAMPA